MHFQDLVFALFVSGAFAAPAALKVTRDSCSDACTDAFNTCRSDPSNNRSTCASNYSSCLGYSPFNNSSGSFITPTACSSTPASKIAPATTTAAAPASAATSDACVSSCNDAYNTCRSDASNSKATCAAEHSSCLGNVSFDSSGSLVTPTACSTNSAAASITPASASIAGIAGGCDLAHPDSCLSSYLSTIIATAINAPLSTTTQVVQASNTAFPNRTSVLEGAGWTVKNLSRYCGEGNTECDYNFALSTNDARADEACTIIRNPGKNASTESWYGEPCATESDLSVSWGVSDQFSADNEFAVLTIINNKEKTKAYFDVANINNQAVTPSNPAGSGQFGDIGPQPVYTS